MTPDYYTPEEVKERLRLKSTQTLSDWRNKRRGPPFRKFGSRVLYPVAELLAWEVKQTVATS